MKQILVETFTPIFCSNDKIGDFTNAYKADSNKLQVDYNYLDPIAHSDMIKRMAQFDMNSGQQPRYLGKYGAVGSVWADNIGGLQNWQAATDAKVAEMFAIENGWDVVASHTETATAIKVKVTGNAKKQTKCNLVVLLADEHNKFKQLFVKQITVPVTKKSLTVSFVPVSLGLKVIVLLQSLNEYTPDGEWGVQEREVFCVTQSVKK